MARIGETLRTPRLTARSNSSGTRIAAVGIGADGEGLGFQVAQGAGLALAHVGVERGLVLEAGAGADGGAAEVGPRGLQRQLVDDALGLVERAVDAGELVGRDGIGGAAALELADALVVAFLEGLEGAHELAEGAVDVVVGGRIWFRGCACGFLVGRDGCSHRHR